MIFWFITAKIVEHCFIISKHTQTRRISKSNSENRTVTVDTVHSKELWSTSQATRLWKSPSGGITIVPSITQWFAVQPLEQNFYHRFHQHQPLMEAWSWCITYCTISLSFYLLSVGRTILTISTKRPSNSQMPGQGWNKK